MSRLILRRGLRPPPALSPEAKVELSGASDANSDTGFRQLSDVPLWSTFRRLGNDTICSLEGRDGNHHRVSTLASALSGAGEIGVTLPNPDWDIVRMVHDMVWEFVNPSELRENDRVSYRGVIHKVTRVMETSGNLILLNTTNFRAVQVPFSTMLAAAGDELRRIRTRWY